MRFRVLALLLLGVIGNASTVMAQSPSTFTATGNTWATQLAAVVPDSVSGGTTQVTVAYQGRSSAAFPVVVAAGVRIAVR